MLELHSTHFSGTVIRVQHYRDSDLIFSVLSHCGKRDLIARHVRGKVVRGKSPPDLFDCGEFIVSQRQRGNLANFQSFAPARSSTALRTNLQAFSIACLLCEVAHLLTPAGEADVADFVHAFELGLSALTESNDLKQHCRACFLALTGMLSNAGYAAHITQATPSRNNLYKLVEYSEQVTEVHLRSKAAVLDCLQELQRPSATLLK